MRLNGISKFQHFRFEASHPGLVFVRETASPTEKLYSILKRCVDINEHERPTLLIPGGLSEQRRRYLVRNVKPLVRSQHRESFISDEIQKNDHCSVI